MAAKKPKRSSSAKKTAGRRTSQVSALKSKLESIDKKLLTAANQRAEVARQLSDATHTGKRTTLDPQVETKRIQELVKGNQGPLSDVAVQAMFRDLISGCREIQKPTRVSYLGPEFTFSHVAALEQFGHCVELVPVSTIGSVFEEVERRQCDYGVVPLENSTDGRVSDTLERFANSPVRICGEIPLRIHHCLLAYGRQDQIEVVHSKPQALSQCRNWLAKHLPDASLRPVGSTAEAATFSRANPKMAAIASEQAAAHYELQVLARNIEDNVDNVTRFAVLGEMPARRTGDDKTALLFEIAHQPGALADTMAIFKRNRLNMTWIESFPIPGSRGRYLFFVEFVGHQRDLRCRRAITSLEKKSLRLEVLGSYAHAEPIG